MRKIFTLLAVLFLLAGCMGGKSSTPVMDEGFDTQTKYFNPEYHNPIAIFPTYEKLGTHSLDTEKAHRKYHVWQEKRTGKIILITVLTPNGYDSFPKTIRWMDSPGALYVGGNTAAYNHLNSRPAAAITKLGGVFPDCFIVAQAFYLDKNRKEAIYKALIVPDDVCAEEFEPVIDELDRVANMQ